MRCLTCWCWIHQPTWWRVLLHPVGPCWPLAAPCSLLFGSCCSLNWWRKLAATTNEHFDFELWGYFLFGSCSAGIDDIGWCPRWDLGDLKRPCRIIWGQACFLKSIFDIYSQTLPYSLIVSTVNLKSWRVDIVIFHHQGSSLPLVLPLQDPPQSGFQRAIHDQSISNRALLMPGSVNHSPWHSFSRSGYISWGFLIHP